MLIYLLRHGIAEQKLSSDETRVLTPLGVSQTRAVVDKFKVYQPQLDKILTSPLLRAKQTAMMLHDLFPTTPMDVEPKLLPDGGVYELLDSIEQLQVHNVFLVSHNPLLSNLLALMIDGTLEASRKFDPSNLYCIEMDFLAPGCGKIVYSLSP